MFCADTCTGSDPAYQVHESNSATPYNQAARDRDRRTGRRITYWAPARDSYQSTGRHSPSRHNSTSARHKVSVSRTIGAGAIGTAVEIAVDVVLSEACPACLVAAGMISAVAGYAATQWVLHEPITVEGLLAAAATGAVGGILGHLALKALKRAASTVASMLGKRAAAQVEAVSDDSAHSAMNAVRLRAQLASREISGGHSFEKHVVEKGEFPSISSRDEFASHIEQVMMKGEQRELRALFTESCFDVFGVLKRKASAPSNIMRFATENNIFEGDRCTTRLRLTRPR